MQNNYVSVTLASKIQMLNDLLDYECPISEYTYYFHPEKKEWLITQTAIVEDDIATIGINTKPAYTFSELYRILPSDLMLNETDIYELTVTSDFIGYFGIPADLGWLIDIPHESEDIIDSLAQVYIWYLYEILKERDNG